MQVISMQLLPGGTLKDRVVERGPLPPAEAVAAILNVIGGLDAAASAGILHRDIKPSNCFVDVDGSVKVGDFGLSISTSAREAKGGSKGFQGTPQYAPPEQLRGEPLDVRADIYAVGATLFYLLTGKAPFESRDFQQLIDQVKNTPPPLAHKIRPGIPPALSAVIVRCLAKDPSARPASYADLASALRPFSGSSRPARRGIRLMAGVVDMVVVGVPVKRSWTAAIPFFRRIVAKNRIVMSVGPIVATAARAGRAAR
jgi:serine/threonine protein kinase